MLLDSFASSKSGRWTLVGLGVLVGIVTGFAVPMAASYQPKTYYRAQVTPSAKVEVLEVPTLIPANSSDVDRDSEVERLEARNRRLVALLATLKNKQMVAEKPPASYQLTSKAVFGQN